MLRVEVYGWEVRSEEDVKSIVQLAAIKNGVRLRIACLEFFAVSFA
jgi:hypothetical protein